MMKGLKRGKGLDRGETPHNRDHHNHVSRTRPTTKSTLLDWYASEGKEGGFANGTRRVCLIIGDMIVVCNRSVTQEEGDELAYDSRR